MSSHYDPRIHMTKNDVDAALYSTKYRIDYETDGGVVSGYIVKDVATPVAYSYDVRDENHKLITVFDRADIDRLDKRISYY